MSKFDAVFYDLDGTLSNSYPLIVECCRQTLESYGKHKTSEEISKELRGLTLRGELELIFEKTMTDEEYAEVSKCYIERQHQLRSSYLKAFPGTLDVIIACHNAGLKQAIVSNRMFFSVKEDTEFLGFAPYVEVLVGPDTVKGAAKPKPDGILYALKELGITDPHRVLYVGDADADTISARLAGCATSIVPYARGLKTLKETPDYYLTSPAQILSLCNIPSSSSSSSSSSLSLSAEQEQPVQEEEKDGKR